MTDKEKAVCKQFKPATQGSSMCACGHELTQHYMCGHPSESRCLKCANAAAQRIQESEHSEGPNAAQKAYNPQK